MSKKKRLYPFRLTDSENKKEYRVIINHLWRVSKDGDTKIDAHAFNVFTAEDGWIGGGSYIELDHIPDENDALRAMAAVLQNQAVRQQAEAEVAAEAEAKGSASVGIESDIEATAEVVKGQVAAEA